MAFVVNDRVQEFTSTTGTGTLTLTGSPDGFETFSSAVGNGNTTYYTISSNTTEFEVGIGTVGAGTLSRDTVISSSNSDALVNFSAGTKNVFVTLPASKTILLNDSDTVDLTGNLDLNSNDITGTGNINITGNLTASGNLTSLGIDDNADATAVTITNQERVGIGITNPSTPLHVTKSSLTGFVSRTGSTLTLENSAALGGTEIYIASSDTSYGQIRFGDTASTYSGGIQYEHNADHMLFQINGAERMRIDSSGNVGIGTTAPDAKLSVNGVASFGDGTALLPSIANFGDLNTGMWFPDADTIAFSEGGTERMRIDSSGNVGIGTSSPSRKLHVVGPGGTAQIQSTGTTSALYFGDTNSSSIDNQGIHSSGNDMFISAGGLERMRIDSSGRLNIGTSTSISGSLLNIDGGFINADVTDNSHKFIRSTANTTGLNDSLLCKVKTTGNMVDGFASVITFALEDSSDVNNNLGFIGATRSGADNSGSLIFHTFNSGSQAERMRITSSGNVGIGTSSPDKLLTVASNSGTSVPTIRILDTNVSPTTNDVNGSLEFYTNDGDGEHLGAYISCIANEVFGRVNSLVFGVSQSNTADATEALRIQSNGKIGIGTTSPDAKLSVDGVASFGDGSAAAPSIANFGNLNTGMWFPAADTIAFSEGGTEAMRINSSGQVGIGSTNPNRTLVLDATSGSNFELKRSPNSGGLYFETDGTDGVMRSVGATGSLIFQTNGTNERMRINSSGNVGIGTTGNFL
jgi:hypothetical protein